MANIKSAKKRIKVNETKRANNVPVKSVMKTTVKKALTNPTAETFNEANKKIDKRVDIMLKNGLEDEAKYFYNKNKNAKSLRTFIGYKELFLYYDKKITKEEAIDLIKKNSRHYAKRQYTWFNNKLNLNWFNVDFNNFDNTINKVNEKIKDYFK